MLPRIGIIVECVTYGLFGGHAAPDSFGSICLRTVGRQPVFVCLASVFKHVFRHFAEIDVQVAPVGRGLVINERIHQPKFQIFDIVRLEIGGFHAARDTSPLVLGVGQITVRAIAAYVHVVRTALTWVERQIKRLYVRGLAVNEFAVREDFLLGNLPDEMVRQLVAVVPQIRRRGRGCTVEHVVDVIPCQQRPVLAVRYVIGIFRFRKTARCAGQFPIRRITHIVRNLGRFEIVDIHPALRPGSRTRQYLCEFGIERDGGRLFQVKYGYAVQEIGNGLELVAVRSIQTPSEIGYGIIAVIHLFGHRFFRKIHERRPDIEMFGKGIIEMRPEQGFAFQVEQRLAFHRNAYRRTEGDYVFIGYADYAHHVIDGIIHILDKFTAAGRNLHRTARHVHRIKADFRT